MNTTKSETSTKPEMNAQFAKGVGENLAVDTVHKLTHCYTQDETSSVIVDALNGLVQFEPDFRRGVAVGIAETLAPVLEANVSALWQKNFGGTGDAQAQSERIASLEAKCILLAASLRQAEAENEEFSKLDKSRRYLTSFDIDGNAIFNQVSNEAVHVPPSEWASMVREPGWTMLTNAELKDLVDACLVSLSARGVTI